MSQTVQHQSKDRTGRRGLEPSVVGYRVLILEGKARERAALNASFLRYGWQVQATGTVGEAIRVLRYQSVDLVLSGFVFVDGTVLEVIGALHADAPATPVIVIAGEVSVMDVVQVMRSGACDVVSASRGLEDLQEAARRAVEGSGKTERERPGRVSGRVFSESRDETSAMTMTLLDLSRRHLEEVLEQAEGNRTRAAQVLGISVRTVRNKIRQYGLPARNQA